MRFTNVIFFCTLFSSNLFGGSRVIKDNRLSDLSIPPHLGRGYSIASNTYQSICMDKIVATKPSYNLKYFYQEIEQSWEDSFKTKVNHESNFCYLFLKSNVDFTLEQSGNTTLHQHHIFTHIKLDSYYNSLNEAESSLSPKALSLLESGDTVGFFDACGPYYIRSIGRHSNFMGLFTYQTASTERDLNFEIKLKATIRGIFAGGGATTTVDSEFHSETESKRLRINIWAYGLGKDHLASIIPTDLNSFTKTVREVITTMQDADTGIVTSMEVTPWIENIHFQNSLKLEATDPDATNERKLKYNEKKNLEANSELIAEINRVDRAQMDQYYKANNCRRILTDDYPQSGPFPYDPELTYFHDLSARNNQSREVLLSYLLTTLSQETVDNYLQTNDEFLYGVGDPTPDVPQGAVGCIEELHRLGLSKVHYRTIEACTTARASNVPIAPILDHYCLPELSRVVTNPEE